MGEKVVRKERVSSLKDEYKEKFMVEIGEPKDVNPDTLMDWAKTSVSLVNDVTDLNGPEKKELVIQIIHEVLDHTTLINPAVDAAVDAAAKLMLPAIIDGLVYMAKNDPLKLKKKCAKLRCCC
jgi:glutamyl-tRNA reductase